MEQKKKKRSEAGEVLDDTPFADMASPSKVSKHGGSIDFLGFIRNIEHIRNPPWLKLSRLKPRCCSLVDFSTVTCTLFVSVTSGCTAFGLVSDQRGRVESLV